MCTCTGGRHACAGVHGGLNYGYGHLSQKRLAVPILDPLLLQTKLRNAALIPLDLAPLLLQ